MSNYNDFIYSNVFETSSGLYDTSTSFINSADVATFIQSNYSGSFISSVDEILIGYSTNSGYVAPLADFDFGRTEESGSFRGEITAYSYQSGLNTGINPTFGDTAPTENADVYDKNDMIDVRMIGIKFPTVFAGFGYDTEGYPVPSRYDQNIAEDSGYYLEPDNSGLIHTDKNLFCDDFRSRIDLWKAGPFDGRWDKHRKMWVAAPEFICGYAAEDIVEASGRFADKTFSSGLMHISTGRYDDFYAPEDSHYKLLVINRSITTSIASGTFMICTRINNGEYHPIWSDCAPDIGS